jgi:hypothetical protein
MEKYIILFQFSNQDFYTVLDGVMQKAEAGYLIGQ